MFTGADELSRLLFVLVVACSLLISPPAIFFPFAAMLFVVFMLDLFFFLSVAVRHWRIIFLLPGCLVAFQALLQFLDLSEELTLIPATRLFVVVTLSVAFFDLLDARKLASGLMKLGIPSRWTFAVFIALNYVELTKETSANIQDSMRLRYGNTKLGILGRLSMYTQYLLLLIVSALRRADMTALSLHVRGFDAFPKRTYLRPHQWTTLGILLVTISLTWFAIILIWPLDQANVDSSAVLRFLNSVGSKLLGV